MGLTDANKSHAMTGLTLTTSMISTLGVSSTDSSLVFDFAGTIAQAGATISLDVSIADVVPSMVPLPASAPMLGGALGVLGAVGYGLKRKGEVAAAT